MALLRVICMVSMISFAGAAYQAMRYFHDYVKDGRAVDGPLPSSLKNVPYYCYQAPSKGPCEGVFMVWFYDIVRRQCMPMFYSGCGGNENRFNNKNECVNACESKRRI